MQSFNYNIAFSNEEVILSDLGEKYAQIKHRLQVKRVLSKMLMDFDVRGQNERNFSTEGTVLWIIDLYLGLKLKCLNNEFVSYKLFF